jgi:hypothetical protein
MHKFTSRNEAEATMYLTRYVAAAMWLNSAGIDTQILFLVKKDYPHTS